MMHPMKTGDMMTCPDGVQTVLSSTGGVAAPPASPRYPSEWVSLLAAAATASGELDAFRDFMDDKYDVAAHYGKPAKPPSDTPKTQVSLDEAW